MDTDDIISYYANLLIIQYRSKPKAYATIQALVTPVIMDQLPTQVMNAFDVTTAVGAQLDIIGKYVGVSRNGFTFSGPITLTDSQFTALIGIMIVRNQLEATQLAIQNFINTFFSGVIQEYAHFDMRISYVYLAKIGTNPVAEFFINLGQLPVPMGVQLALVYGYPSSDYFGFREYTHAAQPGISPLNSYGSYVSGRPFLSYQNIL